jgi:hypothetical protein
MAIFEAVFGVAAKAIVSVVFNKLSKPPEVLLSYGKSGNDDLVRMHYHRPEGPRPAYPWTIIEARVLWPPQAKLYASDEEAASRGPGAAKTRKGLHLKPGSGVLFLPLHATQQYPAFIYLLLQMERAVPGERRWVVARALRPSRFDLRDIYAAH